MTLTTWLIVAIVSLIFSALFSGMEIAYISSDRVRVELDVKHGGLIGKLIGWFYGDSDLFISTLLVGNNIVLVVYGMGMAQIVEPWLHARFTSEAVILLLSTLISTGVILITGEFIPKSVFRINPNLSFKLFALPTSLFYIVLYPLSTGISALSKWLMSLMGIHTDKQHMGMLSVGDLNQYLETAIDDVNPGKTPVENEVKIFHNALDFSSTHLRDCMQPRRDIVAVDIDDTSRDELSALFTSSGRSKIIVYREDIDTILGYIHVSELFDPNNDWKEHIKPVVFVPETLLARKLMRRMLQEKRSLAIVVDEFGGTAGLITLEDLMEEICGDIRDEHDTASDITAREVEPGVYEFSGRIEIDTLRTTYHIDIPEEDDYQTLAGYILHEAGTIPVQGETLVIGAYALTIVRRSATRLELIRVAPAPESKSSDS